MYKYMYIKQIKYCFSNVSLCVEIPESQKFTCTGRDLCSPPRAKIRLFSTIILNELYQLVEISRHVTSAPSLAEDSTNLQFLEFKRLLISIFSSQKITPGHLSFAEECKIWQQVFPTIYTVQLHIDSYTESQSGGD